MIFRSLVKNLLLVRAVPNRLTTSLSPHCVPDGLLFRVGSSIRDQVDKEKDMTIRLPFINHIRILFQNLVNHKEEVALNEPWNHEVQILPLSMQNAPRQNPLPGAREPESAVTVAAPLVYTRPIRFWSVNQESSWYVEHTRSNLG